MSEFSEFGYRLYLATIWSDHRNYDIEERLKVSRRTIGNWDTGRSRPSLDQILQLSDLLGVNIHWLLTGEGPWQAPLSAEDIAEPMGFADPEGARALFRANAESRKIVEHRVHVDSGDRVLSFQDRLHLPFSKIARFFQNLRKGHSTRGGE